MSRDDESIGDNLSIQNQKAMLEKYAEQNGFSNIAHFSDDGYSGSNFNGKVYLRPPKDDYSCSTYSLTNRKFNRQCTQHCIRTVVLRELALEAIKSVSGFVKSNEAEFVWQVREKSTLQQAEAAK